MTDGGHTIYIVDDDRAVRASIGFMLSAAGRTSRAFTGGAELLECLDELEPGCVLVDVRMPGMDGLQLLKALRAQRPGWPVVMMTGHGEGNMAVQALSLGAIDFIEKPFPEDLLFGCLDRAEGLIRA